MVDSPSMFLVLLEQLCTGTMFQVKRQKHVLYLLLLGITKPGSVFLNSKKLPFHKHRLDHKNTHIYHCYFLEFVCALSSSWFVLILKSVGRRMSSQAVRNSWYQIEFTEDHHCSKIFFSKWKKMYVHGQQHEYSSLFFIWNSKVWYLVF